jgi:ABC-type Na+ transport system ATPase subunit NatA
LEEYTIEVENLTKKFGEVTAVEGLNLQVKEGEVFGFLGPNGAGKTTTVRMLCCLISKTGGEAHIAGLDTSKASDSLQIRKMIGLVPDNVGLYGDLSAVENLEFYGKLYECPPERLRENIQHFLKMLGLWERRDARAGSFSKGMMQKLALARALVHEPKVLFMDEPTAMKVFFRKRYTIYSLVIFPVIIGIGLPLVLHLLISRQGAQLDTQHLKDLMNAFACFFAIGASLIPTLLASYSLVGEKVEKSLEPLLAAPIRDSGLLLGKGIGAFQNRFSFVMRLLTSDRPDANIRIVSINCSYNLKESVNVASHCLKSDRHTPAGFRLEPLV